MKSRIRLSRSLLCLCFAVLFSACAKNNLDPLIRAHLEKPDWISGESEKYPPHIYVTGHSVSARLPQAKRQSVDDLVKNIDQQIESSELIDEKTRKLLHQQIRISEQWQDPATLAYHILSTVDRVKVGDLLLDEVYRLDEQVDRILKKAADEKDVLQRVSFANLAIDKQKYRDEIQAIVKIIKPVASVAVSSWDEAKIQKKIDHWLNELKIMPVAQHKEFNLLNAMKDGVSSAGMTVHFGAKPDYILKATFNQRQVHWKDGVYSVEGNLQLELLDGAWKGQVRGGADWQIEVSALEREDLPKQLIEAIRKAHQKNLRSTLLAIEE